jgi:hypothetical protein
VIVPAFVALGVGLAQVLTWMDFMYYYVKVPFVILFAFYGLDRLGRRWAAPLALTLASLSLLLTLRIL